MHGEIIEELQDLDMDASTYKTEDRATLKVGNRVLFKEVFEVLEYGFHRDGKKGAQGADRTLCKGMGR